MSADLSGQKLGHYKIQAVLGQGGMSTVYRAVDERLDRPVALKVISEDLSADAEFRQRFVEEAKAASAIDHVNVVPLYDFGEAGNWLFIAMRLVEGTDLAREVAKGPLTPRRTLDLLGQVGGALDMLHGRGLVHLDIKPANVLVTRNESVGRDHVYVADFGLTRPGSAGHRTASGDFLGSPTYASPEHLRGETIGPASDIYSLTCVLFTCLAGRAPFTGGVKEVVAGHLRGQVPSLSALTELPAAIDRVIARGMAGDPDLRYATSADLLGNARRALSNYAPDPLDDPAPATASGPDETVIVTNRSESFAEPATGPAAGPATEAAEAATESAATAMRPAAAAGGLTLGTSVNDPNLADGQGNEQVTGPRDLREWVTPPGQPGPPPAPLPDFASRPWGTGQPQSGPAPLPPPASPPPERTLWPWALLGFLVLAGIALAIILLTDSGDGQPPPTTDVSTSESSATSESAEPSSEPTSTAPSSTSPASSAGSSASGKLPTVLSPSVITTVSNLTVPAP